MEKVYREIIQNVMFEVPQEIINKAQNIIYKKNIRKETEEEKELYEIEDIMQRILIDLWKNQKYDVILQCYDILEKDNNNIDIKEDFKNLSILINKITNSKSELLKKEFMAKGFECIYAYTEEASVLENILLNKKLNINKEIEIRRTLSKIYHDIDCEENKEKINYYTLLKLIPDDKEFCKSFFKNYIYELDDEKKDTAIYILKKNSYIEYWEWMREELLIDENNYLIIYESVNQEIILSEKVMEYIINAYLKYDITKALDLIEKIKLSNLWNVTFKILEGKYYFITEKYNDALNIFSGILDEDKENSIANLYVAKLYILKEKYEDALKYLRISYDEEFALSYIEEIIWCECKLGNKKKAIQELNNSTKTKYFSSYILYIWILNNYYPKDIMYNLLDKINMINNIIFEDEKDKTLKYIFRITDKINNKGKIRYELICLYGWINEIKNKLRVNKKITKEIYHYSKLDSLNYLAYYEEIDDENKLRLNNVAYMNDPAEGVTLFNIIKYGSKNKKIDNILNRFLENENLNYRNKYLSSFSTQKDFLPMWVQYSDDGNGCCYSIKTNIFDDYDNSTERNIIGTEYEKKNMKFNNDDEKSVLYNVYYYCEEDYDKEDCIILLCKLIGDSVIELFECFDLELISKFVMDSLDEIRYLFKDIAYLNEKEIRVISTDYDKKRKIYKNDYCRVPHFYMDLEKKLEFNEIILGPKVKNVSEISTYLCSCKNVKKVSKSKIKYI